MTKKPIRFLGIAAAALLIFSCGRKYEIYIALNESDVFYQCIKNSLNEKSVMSISAKDKNILSEYAGVLEKMILILDENIENFDNSNYVAKEFFLTDEGKIDFKNISFYRLVYDPENPFAETSGAEAGYVRYYSSNRKIDAERRRYYFELKEKFEKAMAEIDSKK